MMSNRFYKRLQSLLWALIMTPTLMALLTGWGQPVHLISAQQSDLPPYHAAWSPDGMLIATGGIGYFRLWRSETQTLVSEWLLEEGDYVVGLTWNPNSRQIAAVSTDQTLRVWDIAVTGTSVETVLYDTVYLGHERSDFSPKDVDWSPNGQYVAISGVTASGYDLYVWDVASHQWLVTNGYGEQNILWTPDSVQIIRSSPDPSTSIGPIFTPFIRDTNYVDPFREGIRASTFAWSPNGSQLAVGYVDGIIVIRDIAQGTEVLSLNTGSGSSSNGYVIQLVWTSNNRILAIVAAPGGLQLWDVLSQALVRFIALDRQVQTAISPDGERLLLAWSSTQTNVESFILPTSTPTPMATFTPTVTPSRTATPTFTRTPTPLPANMNRLRLAALCSPDPATYRVWRVTNPNPYPVPFTWDTHNGGQTGAGIVPAANTSIDGEITFTMQTTSGTNQVRIYVNGDRQDTKASGPRRC